MTQHTQGEWLSTHDGQSVGDKKGTLIATIHGDKEVRMNHARLIAAAPKLEAENIILDAKVEQLTDINKKLLEALEYLLEEVCKKDGDPFDGATDTAKAAIAAAKEG